MTSVSLLFRNQTLEIPFPENWNDLTTPQLRYCIAAQTSPFSKQKIFYYLIVTNAKTHKIKLPKKWEARLNLEQASAASLTAVNFLFEDNTLTRSPFQTLKFGVLKQHNFTGQKDGLQSLLVQQLEECFPLLDKFRETQQIIFLQKLCAHLFVKQSLLPWAKQKQYNATEAEKNIDLFANCPIDIMLSIYAWLSGCIALLPKLFTDLYPQGENNQPAEFDYLAFTKCIHGSAGPRNGLRHEIRNLLALEFIMDLNLQAAEAKKQEKAAG